MSEFEENIINDEELQECTPMRKAEKRNERIYRKYIER